MGSRANYVLVERTGSSLFYSHTGAAHLARDLFGGPAEMARLIRAQQRCAPTDWLGGRLCEGAALLDIERKYALFFCWSLCCPALFTSETRRVYFEMLAERWPGWQLGWAFGELYDLVDYVGQARDVLGPAPAPSMASDELLEPDAEPPWSIVSVRMLGKPIAHYLFRNTIDQILSRGPSLLDELSRIVPRGALVLEERPEDGGIFIDVPSRRIDYWRTALTSPCVRSLVTARWPGWQGQFYEDAPDAHIARAGGSLQLGSGVTPQALRRVVTMLLGPHNMGRMASTASPRTPASAATAVAFATRWSASSLDEGTHDRLVHAAVTRFLAKRRNDPAWLLAC
jgi:hypothetical protein